MWKGCPEGIRDSRVAMAGSIYMRKASSDLRRSNEHNFEASLYRTFGKIVKNARKGEQNFAPKTTLDTDFSFSKSRELNKPTTMLTPLTQKKNSNTCEAFQSVQLPKRGFSALLSSMEEPQNARIKSIEEKYRTMLTQYQDKKKAIDAELLQLKTGKKRVASEYNKSTMKNSNIDTQMVIRVHEGIQISGHSKNLNKPERAQTSLIKRNNSIRHGQVQNIAKKLSSEYSDIKPKAKKSQKYPEFFQAFQKQIQLEAELRNLKLSVLPSEKEKVNQFLQSSLSLLDEKFLDLNDDQMDPFHQASSDGQLSAEAHAERLAEAYQKSEQHWKNRVCRLDRRDAREIFGILNFEKTRQISLKAFVREVGFVLQKHCRNRDLLRIFNRLEPMTENNFVAQISGE